MDMGLTIKELFRKISLPKHYHGIDFALSQKFAEEAKRFMMLLESCDGSEFRDDVHVSAGAEQRYSICDGARYLQRQSEAGKVQC